MTWYNSRIYTGRAEHARILPAIMTAETHPPNLFDCRWPRTPVEITGKARRWGLAWTIGALFAIILAPCEVRGQLFGQRDLGRPLSRRPSLSTQTTNRNSTSAANRRSSSGDALGLGLGNMGIMVDESARYVRGNRAVTDFVGRDAQDVNSFVGSQQSSGEAEIHSAIDTLDVDVGADASATTAPPVPASVPMYPPRLKVGFDYRPRPKAEVSSQLALRLESSLRNDSSRIEVLVEGDATILRGVVATEQDRRLAELLVRFEPEVARVENQLVVQPPTGAPLPPPPPANSPDSSADGP